jgi:DNA ligase (NAD+)
MNMKFTKEQKDILARSGIKLRYLTADKIFEIAERKVDEGSLNDNQLIEFLTIANALYRGGQQIISDADYDFTFIAELRARHPDHPYLQKVESESAFAGKTVELPVRMLSTEKAYSKKSVEQWVSRIEKVAKEIGKNFNTISFKVTPKLDGFAAYDDGRHLYTRGDGRRGTDITRVFDRGLSVANQGKRGLGAGEIVVNRSYFHERLAQYFDNARNFQASVVKEKELEDHAERAIKDKAAVFHPFALLPSWEGSWQKLDEQFDAVIKEMWDSTDYDVDGVVIEIDDDDIKRHMGSTRHHHRWQIAYKINAETAEVKILDVVPNTSRSGRVNPVALVEPTWLSGAMIHRATAHHYKMVKDKGIGPGALIQLTRSGEVIPKIEKVLTPANPKIPERCPSCNSELAWDGDFLICPNSFECPAQITNSIEHFFKVLGNIDGFAEATIEKLYQNHIRSVEQIYKLNRNDFQKMGFGPKQSENFEAQLSRSRTEKIEDWRFLAAFGVIRLSLGNCERLLQNHRLDNVFKLSEQEIEKIEGFAEKTAEIIVKGLKTIKKHFDHIYRLGFNLERTQLLSEARQTQSPISGLQIVFTGKMNHGNREEMEKEAKKLGAKIGKSVTGNTNLLIEGDDVGAAKTKDAREKGVRIISEDDYLIMIGKFVDSQSKK